MDVKFVSILACTFRKGRETRNKVAVGQRKKVFSPSPTDPQPGCGTNPTTPVLIHCGVCLVFAVSAVVGFVEMCGLICWTGPRV